MPRPLMCPPSLLERDLAGRVFVVTGGNSGIGRETVRQLAAQGATVVLACRRPAEGEKVRGELAESGVRGTVEVGALDLGSLVSVRAFADQVLRRHPSLAGLVNNAGVMNPPAGRTAEGFEVQLGTNHLGHFLLTELLMPALQRGAPSRVVVVSSAFHEVAFGREGRLDFEDLQFDRRPYDGWEAYAQSKLANVLHARHLAVRLRGTGITPVSLHPGWVRTQLIQHSMPVWMQDLARPVLRLAGMIEPWEGIQTTLFTLLAPEVEAHPGAYFSQFGIYRTREARKGGWPMRSPNPHAHDDEAAARLDQVSRALVGLS